jgi:hypothetical protein
MDTQNDDVLWYLQNVGPITPADALREFGIMRLSGRIYDLRKSGVKIKCDMIPFNNRRGRKGHFAAYSLVTGSTPCSDELARENGLLT